MVVMRWKSIIEMVQRKYTLFKFQVFTYQEIIKILKKGWSLAGLEVEDLIDDKSMRYYPLSSFN